MIRNNQRKDQKQQDMIDLILEIFSQETRSKDTKVHLEIIRETRAEKVCRHN